MLGAGLYGVLTAEAKLARKTIGPMIEHPPPDSTGWYGRGRPGPAVRIALLGDSSAAWYGVERVEQTPGAVLGSGVAEHADRLKVHTEFHDTVVVEGAGGLLVRLDTDGGTLLDLAAWLVDRDVDVEVVVVCAAGLGTLNHTELTVGALQARGIPVRGLVIGSWPDSPGLAETCNREDLPRVTGVPLLGAVPAGAGALGRPGAGR